MFQILIIFQPLVPLRKRGEELQVLTALFIHTRILRFTSQLTFAFFAAVSHLSGSLRKQKFTSTDLKGHGLGLVDFNPFCVFVFKGSLLVIVIMIDGSEKRLVVKATVELQSSCVFEKGSDIGVSKKL